MGGVAGEVFGDSDMGLELHGQTGPPRSSGGAGTRPTYSMDLVWRLAGARCHVGAVHELVEDRCQVAQALQVSPG